MLRAGGRLFLAMASGVNRVDVEKISRALGVKAKAADGRWVRDTTGFAIGGVAPVGHIESPRVFIDADLTLDPIWPPPALRVMCFAAHHRAGPADGWYHCRRERMIGAGEGIRTLDPDLGKVVLYP